MAKNKTDKAIQQLLRLATEIKIVWENASPTSSFAAQTVPANMGDYDLYIVRMGRADAYDGNVQNALALLEKGKNTNVYGIISSPLQREIQINQNGFVVTNGELLNNGWETRNNLMVPFFIIGIKFIGGGYSLIRKIKQLFDNIGRRCFIWQY